MSRCPVIDLEEYKARLSEQSADEFATGAQLVAGWESSLYRTTDPTCAHLSEVAAVADEVLAADSFEAMRIALLQISHGARRVIAERLRRVGR